MTPMLQTSTALPYGFCARTSGAADHQNIDSRQNLKLDYLYFFIFPIFYLFPFLYLSELTDISWRTASGRHNPGVFHLRQAEIADHDFAFLVWTVIQEILRLQISVNDTLIVHIVNRLEHLSYQARRVFLCVGTFLDDSVEQFATGDPRT